MTKFGPVEQLCIDDVPVPDCRAGEVLIRVVAAGVNPVDWKECEGHLQAFYSGYTDRWIPGYDAAGTICAVGSGVQGFTIGDRVVAFSDRRDSGHNGTFAEFVRVLAPAVCGLSANVGFFDAAALPTAGLTGYQALFRPGKAALRAGDSVLIHGGAGGVGSFAIQFARARGVSVAATCSKANGEYVASLGADRVIDYTREEVVDAVRRWRPDGVHAVVDCVSGNSLPFSLNALRPGGRLISIATLVQDGDVAVDAAAAAERGFSKILSIIDFDRIATDLGEMLHLMANGQVRAPPLTTYPLQAAASALQRMKAGRLRGKMVLQVH